MLVVSANWGIADGSLVAATRHDQVAWLRTLRRAVMRAGFRRDGRYAPVPRVDVVLAGDTFDLLISGAWTGEVRPWHRGPKARAVRDRVLAMAAARAGRLLAGLRRWARRGIAVPRATRHGRPIPGDEIMVPVGVALLAGDRDAWLEAAQPAAVRHAIAVGAVWSGSACGARVRHGHEFDPLTCGEGESATGAGRGPTLGESLAVDLVGRFGGLLSADADRWPITRRLVADLAGRRPAEAAAAFRRWRQRTGDPPGAVADLWKGAVERWYREARRTRPSCGLEYDPLDVVAATLAMAADDAPRDGAPFDPLVGVPASDPAAAGPLILGHPPGGARLPQAGRTGGRVPPAIRAAASAAGPPAGGELTSGALATTRCRAIPPSARCSL